MPPPATPSPARSPGRRGPRRGRTITLAASVLVLALACSDRPERPPGRAVVERVADGDTIVVDLGGEPVTVRLIGIDTPETHHPAKPVECHGPEASERIEALLPPGTLVDLRRDVELHDVHGRLLAYVTRAADGLDVNLTMAREGHADVLRIPPNTASAGEVRAAVDQARAAGLGLWGHCTGAHVPAEGGADRDR